MKNSWKKKVDQFITGKYSGWTSGLVFFVLSPILVWIGKLVSGNIWAGVSIGLFVMVVILVVVTWWQRFLLKDLVAFKTGKNFHIITLHKLNLVDAVMHSEFPKGMVWLRGVKFFITASEENNAVAKVISVRPTATNEANLIDIPIGLGRILEVYLIITTNYGVKSFKGAKPGDAGDRWDEKLAGYIEPIFSDGTHDPKFNLRLGHDIRDFHFGNQPDAIDTLKNEGITSFQVWHSSQCKHTLDMIAIKINDQSKMLDKLRVVAQMEKGANPLSLRNDKGELVHEPAYPEIWIFGVTCRVEENN